MMDAYLARLLQIQSDRNISFDKKPIMKSAEIAATAVEALKSGKYNQAWLQGHLVVLMCHL